MPNPGDEARRKLIAQERAEQLRVLSEFQKIQTRLSADLYDLLREIEHTRQTEGNATPGQLFRQARTRQLFEQVSDEILTLSNRLGLTTANLQRRAVDIARDQLGEYAVLSADLVELDTGATRKLIGIAGDGQPLAEHFAAIKTPVRQKMFDALFYGIAAGLPNQAIAREVNQAVEFGAARALTIVRTETNRAYREASREFYDQSGQVVGWRWLAACDLNTCLICWSNHGRVFETREPFATHPNCRCTMVPVFADDPEYKRTGPAMFANLNRTQQKTIAGPRRLGLYEQGAELSDFVETYRSTFGLSRRIRPLESTNFTVNPRTPAAEPGGPPRPANPPAVTPNTASKAFAFTPGEPPPASIKTPAEFNEYFERRYPDIRFDWEGLHPKVIRTLGDELVRLFDEFPEVAGRLKYVGTYATPEKWKNHASDSKFNGANAHAYTTGRVIAFNPKKLGDADAHFAARKHQFQIGWFVSPAKHGTATHEFGHLVDFWLDTLGNDSLTPYTDFDIGGVGRISTIKAQLTRKFKPKTAAEISGYAREDRLEQFAEGFSMVRNRPADEWAPFAKAINLLIELVRGRRVDRGRVQRLADLPDADQRAEKRKINDLYEQLGLKPPFKKREL